MPANKEYLVRLLLRRMNTDRIMERSLQTLTLLCKNTYPRITEDDVREIESRFNVEVYLQRVFEVFDRLFTVDEVQELLKFFSSPLGQKLNDSGFLVELERIGKNLSAEIEQEFSIRNAAHHRQVSSQKENT